MRAAFACSPAAAVGRRSSGVVDRRARRYARPRRQPTARLSSGETTRPAALLGGGAILSCVFANRVFLTAWDALPPAQPRADLLAVAAAATLVLYGLTRAEVVDRTRVTVEMGGVEVREGFGGGGGAAARFADWAARAIFAGAPAVKSFALVVRGKEVCRVGRFRDETATAAAPAGGIAASAADSGRRAYLADLKVVPVREVEFGFLPENCQSVVVQPVSSEAVLILGADTPRPFTGSDFGWLQAISDKLAEELGKK